MSTEKYHTSFDQTIKALLELDNGIQFRQNLSPAEGRSNGVLGTNDSFECVDNDKNVDEQNLSKASSSNNSDHVVRFTTGIPELQDKSSSNTAPSLFDKGPEKTIQGDSMQFCARRFASPGQVERNSPYNLPVDSNASPQPSPILVESMPNANSRPSHHLSTYFHHERPQGNLYPELNISSPMLFNPLVDGSSPSLVNNAASRQSQPMPPRGFNYPYCHLGASNLPNMMFAPSSSRNLSILPLPVYPPLLHNPIASRNLEALHLPESMEAALERERVLNLELRQAVDEIYAAGHDFQQPSRSPTYYCPILLANGILHENQEIHSYVDYLVMEHQFAGESSGLSDDVILELLPRKRYELQEGHAPSDAEACCICKNEVEHEEEIAALDCGHDFHIECITQWLVIKNNCPICKMVALSIA